MVLKCCVLSCKNHAYTPNVSLHNFTKDPELIHIWIEKIGRNPVKSRHNPRPFRVSKHTKICSAHFVRGDFSIKAEKNRLKPTAVPSIFPWTPLSNDITSNTSRTETVKLAEPSTIKIEEICENVKVPEVMVDFSEERRNHIETDVTAATIQKISSTQPTTSLNQENSGRLEYSNLRKFYTDLLIEHHEFVKNCKCQKVKSSGKTVYIDTEWTSVVNKDISFTEHVFKLDKFKHSDSEIFYYTGFTNFTVLQVCLNMLFECGNENFIRMHNSNAERIHMSIEDEFFLVLIKLKQNLGYKQISKLFNVSVATVCSIFISWINFIFIRLGSLDIWAHRNVILSHCSNEFKENYPDVIGSLDAIEINIQSPSSTIQQHSHYKHNCVVKGLVIVDCNGSVIFVSSLFIGPISDDVLIQRSGLKKVIESKLNRGFLNSGDSFLADVGFRVTELSGSVNIIKDVFRINNLAHVEGAIGRVKSYKILSSKVSMPALGLFNKVWTVCCALSNFQKPFRPTATS